MDRSELLHNIASYKEQIRRKYPQVQAKRMEEEIALEFTAETALLMANHCWYLIEEIATLIEKQEKEQRIHRHYGFLQGWVMFLLQKTLAELMHDNKYGTI